MTEQDKAILDTQSDKVLAEWYSLLNNWQWPSTLPNPEPIHHVDRRGQLMDYIEDEIGSKECLRWAWQNVIYPTSYSHQEFEDWWTENHVLNKPMLPTKEPRRGLVKANAICVCGAKSVGSAQHSTWCDAY